MSGLNDATLQIRAEAPGRASLGRSVNLTLLMGALFVAYVVSVKDVRSMSAIAPWTEDPYDAFFSFAIFFVALSLGLSSVRLLMCRRSEVLPAGRLVALIRGCWVILGSVLVTFGVGWLSFAASSAPEVRLSPSYPVVGLAIETVLALLAAALLWTSGTQLAISPSAVPSSPDWLTDAISLGTTIANRFGPGRSIALRIVAAADHHVAAGIRRHPLPAALALALFFGAFVGLGAAIEQDPVILVVLITAIGAGGMLAFVVIVGSYLGLARRSASVSRRPGGLVLGAIAAGTSLPITVAFRDSLWWIIGTDAAGARLEQFAELLGTIAVVTFVAVLLASLVSARVRC